MEEIIAGLVDEAERINAKSVARRADLVAQIGEAEQRVLDLKIALDLERGSDQRLLDFRESLGRHLTCPRCQMRNAIVSVLVQIPSEDFDIVECKARGCGFRFEADA